MPKVSVISPIHNPGKYLRPLLESLVNQTLPDIEIILVDDGSTDGSREILKEYEQKDNRIKVFFRTKAEYERFGEKYSVDLGRAIANGEYIMIVDHDDELMRDALEILYSYTNNGTIDVVQGRNFTIDENDGLVYKTPDFFHFPTIISSNKYLQDLSYDVIDIHLLSTPVALWTCLIKNSFIKHIELADCIYNDTSFIWKLKILAKHYCYAPEYIYKQNQYASSTSGQNNVNKNVFQIFYAFEDLRNFIQNLNLSYEFTLYFSCYEFRMLLGHTGGTLKTNIHEQYMDRFAKEIQKNPNILDLVKIRYEEKWVKLYEDLMNYK